MILLLCTLAHAQQVVEPASPVYPTAAIADRIAGTVIVWLVIEADGTVSDAGVESGLREDVDAAAIEAARRLRFAPLPEATRIRYAFTFALQVGDEQGNAVPATFDVVVTDPLGLEVPGVTVTLTPLSGGEPRTAVTSANGKAHVAFLPPGAWSVRFEKEGFAVAGATFEVEQGETRVLELVLEPAGPMEELVVIGMRQRWRDITRARREPVLEPVTGSYELTRRDVESTPGALEDVNRAVHKLPGVASDGDMLGAFSVRGHAPEEVVFLLDRVPLDNPYHLAGFNSVFNPDMLANVRFFAGGAPSSYPTTTSAVMDVTSWDGAPKDDRHDIDGDIDVSMSTARLMVMGPVGKEVTFAVAARRSYLESYFAAMKALNLLDTAVAAPEYDEVSARVAWRPGKHRFLLSAMRAGDHLSLVDSDDESVITIDGTFKLENVLWLTSLDHRVELGEGDVLQTTAAWSRDESHIERDFAGRQLRDTTREQLFGRRDLGLGAGAHHVDVGGAARVHRYTLEGGVDDTRLRPTWAALPLGNYPYDEIRLQETGWSGDVAGYANHGWDGPVRTRAGLRSTWVSRTGEVLLSPSVGLSVPLPTGTVPKISGGLYHHIVEDPLQVDPVYGNPDLLAERSAQVVVGVDQALPIGDGAMFRVEGFYASLDRLVVNPDDRATLDTIHYENLGEGHDLGVDVLFAGRAGRFDWAWNFSWLDAERTNPLNVTYAQTVRPAWWQPVTTGLTLEYQVHTRWRLTGRYDFHAGRPMSSVEPGGVDHLAITGLNDQHLGVFNQVDLRVEYRVATARIRWQAYLEVLNVLNVTNDFLPTATVEDGVLTPGMLSHLPVRPFLGVRADF